MQNKSDTDDIEIFYTFAEFLSYDREPIEDDNSNAVRLLLGARDKN